MSKVESDSVLKMTINNQELKEITSPNILYIIQTIKAIQKRMKDPDLVNEQYIHVYDKLGKEFSHFSDTYTMIFTNVIRGEKLDTIASVLYYKDKVNRGLITEEQLSDLLAKKFLPEHLKKEADSKIKEMRENGLV